MTFRAGLVIAATALLVACGGPEPTPAPTADLSALDGHTRLGHSVKPLHYTLDLTVEPTADRLEGTVEIKLVAAGPTERIQLHGRDLTVHAVALKQPGKPTLGGKASPIKNGGLVVDLKGSFEGEATLQLGFKAPKGLAKIPAGLYQVKDDGKTYGITQFEAMDARRAFPCFDQPEFKTPFKTRLRVPKGELGVSNSLELSRKDEGTHTVFDFAETKPLPTYLVAFAVGPWAVVDGPKDAIPNTPLRILSVPGKSHLTAFAMQRTAAIHGALSDYFGRPHPFDKLDLIGVPNFAAGAMENVGLVTFREILLLLDPERSPVRNQVWAAEVIAHELAHMWFGNLVTPLWWDELWLNEAFATWMEAKAVDAVLPELEEPVQIAVGAQRVMELDAKRNARAIRQPIKHGGDVRNAFDGITYTKGAAVLQMIEAWIGVEAFRTGTRAYMDAHAYGNGTTAKLMAALEKASGKNVGEVTATFIDQPGTPLVTLTPRCEGGKGKLKLAQRRYVPLGSEAKQSTWKVPFCARYSVAGKIHRQCTLIESASAELTLEEGCPEWIHPNADQLGYYRWSLPKDALLTLVSVSQKALSKAERSALPHQLTALFKAGELPPGVYMQAIEDLAKTERHWLAIQGIASAVNTLKWVLADDEAALENLARWTRKTLKPITDHLGTARREGEPTGDSVARPKLIAVEAIVGRDPARLNQAREVADEYLGMPALVSADTLAMALPIAARNGDAALWQMLRQRVIAAKDPATRSTLVSSLGAFKDPALFTRSLNLVLDGTLRAQDLRGVMRHMSSTTRQAGFQWLKDNYDRVLEVLGKASAGRLPGIVSGFCSAEDAAKAKAFFEQPAHNAPGVERNLGLAVERIEECARIRKATGAAITTWLSQRPQ